MKIEYLKKLKENPIDFGELINFEIEGITLNEIEHLEQLYNTGKSFPKVLKELLFLAGKYCYVCDYGPNENQTELQESIREDLLDNERTISRPFYVIDVYSSERFMFIYLDEGNNPTIYTAHPSSETQNWITQLSNLTIKSLIDNRVERAKRGENPF
ncbi:hypothetical protein SOM12_23140 [Flavobacterium sp. CFBP9031]|uniref:hypothetical protein n=1 Tax=Flavobacterium sp. CFBP9031 TaxID=3096538 RepID=UPI002A69F958|nr:hypothetical protein [Flavobacterium sp. CFBP9031]MDY0990342.1 hypothetical protein [Flavobacterium sp. CFBP9031]